MDAGNLVDNVAQEVTAPHPVVHAPEHGGYNVAPVVAVGTCDGAQVVKKARTASAVGPGGFLVVDKSEEFIAGDALRIGGPIAPAVGRFDGGLEALSGKLDFFLALKLQVIEELQEHDPGEHWQTVEVAIEALVLAHDVARGFQERTEGLGGSGG